MLKLYYHCRQIGNEREQHHVRKSASRSHLLYHRILIQCIEISQIDRALKRILIVVASVARHMDMALVKRLCHSLLIALKRRGKQLL